MSLSPDLLWTVVASGVVIVVGTAADVVDAEMLISFKDVDRNLAFDLAVSGV